MADNNFTQDEVDKMLRQTEDDVIRRIDNRQMAAQIAAYMVNDEGVDKFEEVADRVYRWIHQE